MAAPFSFGLNVRTQHETNRELEESLAALVCAVCILHGLGERCYLIATIAAARAEHHSVCTGQCFAWHRLSSAACAIASTQKGLGTSPELGTPRG